METVSDRRWKQSGTSWIENQCKVEAKSPGGVNWAKMQTENHQLASVSVCCGLLKRFLWKQLPDDVIRAVRINKPAAIFYWKYITIYLRGERIGSQTLCISFSIQRKRTSVCVFTINKTANTTQCRSASSIIRWFKKPALNHEDSWLLQSCVWAILVLTTHTLNPYNWGSLQMFIIKLHSMPKSLTDYTSPLK